MKQCLKIDFVEVRGAGSGSVREQPPHLAVGENAPQNLTVCVVVDLIEIANELGSRIGCVQRVVLDGIVQRTAPILGLRDRLAWE